VSIKIVYISNFVFWIVTFRLRPIWVSSNHILAYLHMVTMYYRK